MIKFAMVSDIEPAEFLGRIQAMSEESWAINTAYACLEPPMIAGTLPKVRHFCILQRFEKETEQ